MQSRIEKVSVALSTVINVMLRQGYLNRGGRGGIGRKEGGSNV